jgi:hypothetical protein
VNDYIKWMNSEEYREMSEADDKFFAEHWANDLLDAPHALIAVIETKIARAVIAREREIIKLLEEERLKHVPWCGKEECLMCERTVGIERAMGLIQGQQK